MKKNLLKTICMALIAMLCVTNVFAQFAKKAPESTTPKFTVALKQQPTPSRSVIYSEDFEGTVDDDFGTACTPQGGGDPLPYAAGPVPTGWTVSTTGKWKSYSDQDLMECVSDIALPHSGVRMMGNSWINSGNNNWAFSAGFTLEAGIAYDITFWYDAVGWAPSEPDKFEVRIGTTATASAMGSAELVFSNTALGDGEWSEATKTFTPTAGGTYYLGFRDTRGNQYGFAILIDDITITEKGAATFCDPVTNLQAEVQGKDIRLTWTAAAGEPTNYKIYNGTTSLGTTTNTYYMLTNVATGTYTYGVEAIYSDDCEPLKVTTTVEMPVALNPVKDLEGNCNDGTLTLTWTEPDVNESGFENWLSYLVGEYAGGLGGSVPANLMFANRWSPADLADMGITTGSKLTKITHFFNSTFTGGTIDAGDYIVKVWQGSSSTQPGDEKYSGATLHFPGDLIEHDWNETVLETPVIIDASLELWFGVHANITAGTSNACPYGTGGYVNGVNMVRWNNAWKPAEQLLTTFSSGNWALKGYVVSEGGAPIEVSHYNVYQNDVKLGESTTTTYSGTGAAGLANYCVVAAYDNATSVKVCKSIYCGACNPPTDLKVSYAPGCGSVTLSWTAPAEDALFNIYKNGVLVKGNLAATTFTLNILENTDYTWEVKTSCGGTESDGITLTDKCVGVDEHVKTAFSIVPNPAKDGNIQITSGTNFNKIDVISFLGQTVISQPNDGGNTARVDVSNLPSGVYFVRIISEQGVNVQKFVKQ